MKQTLKNIEASLIKICDHILSDEEKAYYYCIENNLCLACEKQVENNKENYCNDCLKNMDD